MGWAHSGFVHMGTYVCICTQAAPLRGADRPRAAAVGAVAREVLHRGHWHCLVAAPGTSGQVLRSLASMQRGQDFGFSGSPHNKLSGI